MSKQPMKEHTILRIIINNIWYLTIRILQNRDRWYCFRDHCEDNAHQGKLLENMLLCWRSPQKQKEWVGWHPKLEDEEEVGQTVLLGHRYHSVIMWQAVPRCVLTEKEVRVSV